MAWPLVKIKECCAVVGGATPKRNVPEYWGNDIPWVTPKDISNLDQPVLEDAPEYISQVGYDSAATYMLPKGAILLTSRAPIGNVAIAGREMCTNQGFKSLVPGKDVDSKYLYYCMKRMAPKLESIGNGATFKEVSKSTVEDFEIPLPPLKEQKRIATILDKADAIRRKRQKAIQLADEFLRSVFLDMFGDPVANPKGWDIKLLSEVGEIARGKSKHRPRNDPVLLGGEYPLIQTGDVANANHYITSYTQTYSEIGLAQSKMWPAGTLCITIAANIADTAILTFDACFPDSVVGFTPGNLVRTEYIHMWLQFYQKILRDKAPESAQKNINLKILSELNVPIPEIHLQDQFVDIFNSIERVKGRMRDSNSGFTSVFQSISQRAFRGDL